MIAEYLNREVVVDELRKLVAHVETTGEHSELLGELKAAENASGQPSFQPPPAERRGRGGEPAPLDDFAFISRDPVMSLLQSALDEHADDHPQEVVSTPPPDDARRGAGEVVAVSDTRLKTAPPPHRTPDGRRIFDKFSITDARWISSKVAEGIRAFRGKHDFKKTPAPRSDMPDRVRLVIVGDWGSGLPRARQVADQMRKVIEEGVTQGLTQHVIHLGDVYYSGYAREYQKHMIPYWPVKNEEAGRIGSWTINGNHDMYSGGYGYYDVMLADPRFSRQAQSSIFSLVNKHWKIVGLDTSYEDAKLCDPQPDWLSDEINTETRRVFLLSHHQLFSAYEKVSQDLVDKVSPILQRRQNPVDAWFWGHEHRCMLYNAHANVNVGRCIGHGGIPVYQWHNENDEYPAPGSYEYRAFHQKGLERWAVFGFAVVDLDGRNASVRYIDENGFTHRTESF